MEQNVVAQRIARAAVANVNRPAAVGRLIDRVVDNDVASRPSAAIDAVERDAAGVIVVQQIVLDARVLHAVHVDAAAAARLTLGI
jgi:hypothetical protein